MPSPSIDGVSYQLRVKWLYHGQTCYNVLAFTSFGVQDLLDDLLTPVLACIVDNLLPVLSEDCQLIGADVKNLTGSVAQEVEQTVASDSVGGTAVDALPSTNAAVVALRTTHPGRSGRGRIFLPGIPESHSADSTLDAAFLLAAANFLACMAAAYIAGDPPAAVRFDWVIHSRKDNAFYPVSSYAVRNVIGTMRSRKVG